MCYLPVSILCPIHPPLHTPIHTPLHTPIHPSYTRKAKGSSKPRLNPAVIFGSDGAVVGMGGMEGMEGIGGLGGLGEIGGIEMSAGDSILESQTRIIPDTDTHTETAHTEMATRAHTETANLDLTYDKDPTPTASASKYKRYFDDKKLKYTTKYTTQRLDDAVRKYVALTASAPSIISKV